MGFFLEMFKFERKKVEFDDKLIYITPSLNKRLNQRPKTKFS